MMSHCSTHQQSTLKTYASQLQFFKREASTFTTLVLGHSNGSVSTMLERRLIQTFRRLTEYPTGLLHLTRLLHQFVLVPTPGRARSSMKHTCSLRVTSGNYLKRFRGRDCIPYQQYTNKHRHWRYYPLECAVQEVLVWLRPVSYESSYEYVLYILYLNKCDALYSYNIVGTVVWNHTNHLQSPLHRMVFPLLLEKQFELAPSSSVKTAQSVSACLESIVHCPSSIVPLLSPSDSRNMLLYKKHNWHNIDSVAHAHKKRWRQSLYRTVNRRRYELVPPRVVAHSRS